MLTQLCFIMHVLSFGSKLIVSVVPPEVEADQHWGCLQAEIKWSEN